MNKIAKYSRSQDYYKSQNGPVVVTSPAITKVEIVERPTKPRNSKDRYNHHIIKFYRRVEADPRNRRHALLIAARSRARDYADIDLAKLRKQFEKSKYKLMKLKDHVCYVCESTPNHRHHIIPLGRGGRNEVRNLVALCEDCHTDLHPWMIAAKQNKDLDDRLNHLIGV